MIGQTISHYRILARLGEGGMGEVFVAEDTLLSRRVAIKFANVHPNEHPYQARFLREARALSALNHPHIAAVYDYGETAPGQPYIVMELIAGRDLGKILQTDGLTIARTLNIGADVADALAEAHQHGIIHRDIKPANIMLDDRGRVKILDFGLAKLLDPPAGVAADQEAQTLLATRTSSGVVVGTPLYLSPEQAGGMPVDGRSDLFALAAVLYECVTGRPAFIGTNVIEICAAVLHVDPPPPSQINPHVPPELDQIILKGLAKKPEARQQTAADLSADLRAVMRHLKQGASQMPTQQINAADTPFSRARGTLSATLRQPRFSPVFLILLLLTLGSAWFGVRWLLRTTPHTPTPEALRWYQTGETALRDGTYNTASKALENAVAADAQFALAHARLAEAWAELDYSDKAKDELLTVKSLVPDPAVLPGTQALYLEAITNTVLRNFPRAIENYNEIVRQAPQPEQSYAYVDLGRAYEKNEQIEQAIESYVQATTRDPQAAAAFLHLGILHGRKQELASALAQFEQAEKLYRSLSNFEGVAEVLYQRGLLYNKLGQIAEAHAQLQQALAMTQVTSNQDQHINVLLQLSISSYTEGNTTQAKQQATEAMDLAEREGIENLATLGLIDLGRTFYVRREYAEAEQSFRRALEFAQRAKGQRNKALALLALGRLFIQQEKNIDEGLGYIEQALAFFQQGGYGKEIAEARLLRARAKLQNGDRAAALQEFNQQLQLAEQVNDPSQLARSHLLIGSLLADQEIYPEALHHFEASYTISRSLNSQLELGYCLLDRSDMLWRLGHYEPARELLNDVPSVAAHLDSEYKQVLLARSHLIYAQMALSERHFSAARLEAGQALLLAGTQIKRTGIEAKYTLGLAQALSGAGQQGIRTCREAVDLAMQQSDPRVLSIALLTLAEALLATNAAPDALATAHQAIERFAHANQQESEARAHVIAGYASQRMKDQETARKHLTRANELFIALREQWGADAFAGYLARADLQFYLKQSGQAPITPQ